MDEITTGEYKYQQETHVTAEIIYKYEYTKKHGM